MPHQINLLDPSLQRRHDRLGSTAGLLAVIATLAVSIVATFGLNALATRTGAQAEATERELVTVQASVASVSAGTASPLAAELARLRAAEAAQQRIRAALDSGQAGVAQGYSNYLFALSRQAQEGLWLTRFDVAPDSRSLELGGRMTDPRQLPDYLRRLKVEPLFNGRQFAQLSLKSVELNEGARVTEFALRSAPTASAPDLRP
jgi:hypothetical protein